MIIQNILDISLVQTYPWCHSIKNKLVYSKPILQEFSQFFYI